MKVTLEFDDQKSATNFIYWWLDGGGEQYLDFNTTSWNTKSGYLRIEGTGSFPEE